MSDSWSSNRESGRRQQSIAIVATDGVCALGAGIETIFERMLRGESGVRPMGDFGGGVITDHPLARIPVDAIDEALDGRRSDGIRSAMMLAHQISDPVIAASSVGRDRIGLVVATTKADVHALERRVTSGAANHDGPDQLPAFTNALAEAIGITGPRITVSNACASGLAAILLACSWLRRRWCDQALVVGVDVLSRFVVEGFRSLGILSRFRCRPFDADRDGMNLGEAAAVMLLARREDVACPQAEIAGGAATCDAQHMTAPDSDGRQLANVVTRALERSRLVASDVDYVNAHGTGTVINDASEAAAIHAALGPDAPVSSMKGYFGHTLGAAGVLEAALCLEVLRRDLVPASLGFERPGFDDTINVLTEVRSMPVRTVVTFKRGLGGLNAAAVIRKPDVRA